MSNAFSRLQKLLPQHGLSRLVGRFTSARHPWIRRPLISTISRAYNISLSDAARKHPDDYLSFDDFFTRELAEGARPLPSNPNAIVSPADGTLSQCGDIQDRCLLQAKGIQYRLGSLLEDEDLARRFDGGWFSTIYLAPADYHRVHVPYDGRLIQSTAIPGALFSVNGRTEAGIIGLFCRNERLVCLFETEFGPMVVVLVGALIVASIDTLWHGPISPYQRIETHQPDLPFERGAELARFRMGSTAIVILPAGVAEARPEIIPGHRVRMGETLAERSDGT